MPGQSLSLYAFGWSLDVPMALLEAILAKFGVKPIAAQPAQGAQ